MRYGLLAFIVLSPSLSLAQESPHDLPHRMGGLPGMTEQTLQETAPPALPDRHGRGRPVDSPEREFTFGRPGESDRVSRTVNLELSDGLRILPASFNVARGETVRIIVHNPGKLRHQLLLGDLHYQHEHSLTRQLMARAGDSSVNALAISPGETAELLWAFEGPNDVDIACHYPGHYEAGMRARVRLEK